MELAALTPGQRNAQAWYSWQRQAGEPLLANPGEREARPLVLFNPDSFDRSARAPIFQMLVVGRLYDTSESSPDPQDQRIIGLPQELRLPNLAVLVGPIIWTNNPAAKKK